MQGQSHGGFLSNLDARNVVVTKIKDLWAHTHTKKKNASKISTFTPSTYSMSSINLNNNIMNNNNNNNNTYKHVPRKLRDCGRAPSDMSSASTAMGSHSYIEDMSGGSGMSTPMSLSSWGSSDTEQN